MPQTVEATGLIDNKCKYYEYAALIQILKHTVYTA